MLLLHLGRTEGRGAQIACYDEIPSPAGIGRRRLIAIFSSGSHGGSVFRLLAPLRLLSSASSSPPPAAPWQSCPDSPAAPRRLPANSPARQPALARNDLNPPTDKQPSPAQSPIAGEWHLGTLPSPKEPGASAWTGGGERWGDGRSVVTLALKVKPSVCAGLQSLSGERSLSSASFGKRSRT